MKESEFLAWFVAQHGPREQSSDDSDLMLRSFIRAGKAAEEELAARELWDEKKQSALYAWTAKEQA